MNVLAPRQSDPRVGAPSLSLADRVRSFASSAAMEGSAQDAEDLTQWVFLRVLRALGRVRERQLERGECFRRAECPGRVSSPPGAAPRWGTRWQTPTSCVFRGGR